jgi:nucleoside-diphosphate-sugar epimerase
MRVLVTGAAGFIGAHVVRGLIAKGHEAFALVRPGNEAARLEAVADQITVVSGDLGDADRTSGLVADVAPDAIIHLAWFVEPGAYRHAVAENAESVRASATLLQAAAGAGCPRVVLGGTCLEGDVGSDQAIYESAKAAVHRLSDGFADAGVTVACGHVFHLYGPMEDERPIRRSPAASTSAPVPSSPWRTSSGSSATRLAGPTCCASGSSAARLTSCSTRSAIRGRSAALAGGPGTTCGPASLRPSNGGPPDDWRPERD